MKYLDANIFIIPILHDNERAKKCKQIITNMANRDFEAVTSLLTWDEIVYVLIKLRGKDFAVKEGKKFLEMPNLEFIRSDENIIIKAQELVEIYEINPRDAIHAASALLSGTNEVISDDEDFDKIKEIKRIKI
jgi:uncharacterized protein